MKEKAETLIKAVERRYIHCPIAVRDKAQFPNGCSDADLIVVTETAEVYEFEIKLDRADFLRDKRKSKMGIYDGTRGGYRPNRFWYVAPEGVVTKDDLPWWAGLMVWKDGELLSIRMAPPFGKGKFPMQLILRLARKMREDTTAYLAWMRS